MLPMAHEVTRVQLIETAVRVAVIEERLAGRVVFNGKLLDSLKVFFATADGLAHPRRVVDDGIRGKRLP